MSRKYVVFGSNDGETLVLCGEYEAADHDGARKQAAEAGHHYNDYGSTPAGNWVFGALEAVTVYKFVPKELKIPGQMTVNDVIEEAKKDEIKDEIAEARRAIRGDDDE